MLGQPGTRIHSGDEEDPSLHTAFHADGASSLGPVDQIESGPTRRPRDGPLGALVRGDLGFHTTTPAEIWTTPGYVGRLLPMTVTRPSARPRSAQSATVLTLRACIPGNQRSRSAPESDHGSQRKDGLREESHLRGMKRQRGTGIGLASDPGVAAGAAGATASMVNSWVSAPRFTRTTYLRPGTASGKSFVSGSVLRPSTIMMVSPTASPTCAAGELSSTDETMGRSKL